MTTITLLNNKTLVLMDDTNRMLMYIPTMTFFGQVDHYTLEEYEIMSYLYENTTSYEKTTLLVYED